ncbi:MAG: 4Fe-4S dicluster domain-containing protein [Dehalococcoidales bacterium]|nr:4Fe-4S dicluster domain-containing protein [Dehalococcoidales bacterium]
MNKSILIIDDEPIVRESIRDWLKDAGYQVSTAESGEQALEMIKQGDFGILVVDIRLPGMTGINVLEKAKALKPQIKSVVITAYPTEEVAAETKKLGAIDYLIKPVSPADLEKLIEDTLEKAERDAKTAKPVKKEPSGKEAGRVKQSFVLSKGDVKTLTEGLAGEMEVIGVRAKQGKFVYSHISNFDDLCLDYDVTIMPPTQYLFPEKETLLKYQVDGTPTVEPVTEETRRAIIGIHPYDLKAIDLLDEVFIATNPDPNYIARRNNTIIIGVDTLHPSPHTFAPSMGTNVVDGGFDLFLTDIGGKYVATAGTKQGSDLLAKYTKAKEAGSEDILRQKLVREQAWEDSLLKHGQFLNVPKEKLPKMLEENYDNPYWETRSESCLSCGSCVMVCPTCFCFDVQDEADITLKSGQRIRSWDGCMLVDFAKVATGENFRHDKASRFRHRIFRKGKYVMERYGKMGCVGCGRCAAACLAEIASPLEAFNAIAESTVSKKQAKAIKTRDELYLPDFAEIINITSLTPREKVFEFKMPDGKILGQMPGQFVEVLIPTVGEAPISVSSSPTRGKTFQLAVRDVGSLTHTMHGLQTGAKVGIRGPFGNGFPIEKLKGKDILFIAGGIGLFPLRSLVQYVMDERNSFGKVMVLFGARSPAERLFTDELASWSQRSDIEFLETVDRGDDTWKGNVGVITTLIPKVEITPRKTIAVVVGPPVMYRFVIVELKKRDLPDENIIMSLERRMKCGVGKCGHCQINGVYVCQEGPVFSYAQLRNLREAV